MAAISITNNIGFALRDQMKDAFATAKTAYEARREYRNIRSQLSALSARELADIGLNRSMIGSIAYEAVYGKNG